MCSASSMRQICICGSRLRLGVGVRVPIPIRSAMVVARRTESLPHFSISTEKRNFRFGKPNHFHNVNYEFRVFAVLSIAMVACVLTVRWFLFLFVSTNLFLFFFLFSFQVQTHSVEIVERRHEAWQDHRQEGVSQTEVVECTADPLAPRCDCETAKWPSSSSN
jgi:hypothetical protein